MIKTIISMMESGTLPDTVIRAGIRKLCKQRLEEEHINDIEAQSEQYDRFLQELRRSDIAIKTDKANEQHYEVPADFYLLSLGEHLKYSGCLWDENTQTLSEAEENMLELYTKRGEFVDGQSILELGCGWGSLTLYLAKKYPNSQITTISNSSSQRQFIESKAKERGLSNIEVITVDINQFETDKTFDRIVSIEMFEHIRNYQQLFQRIEQWLNDEGKVFLHIFCHRYLMYPFEEEGDDNWMGKYFFSGGQMPAADTFLHFQGNLDLEKRWLLSGKHYEKTSNAWLENTDKNKDSILSVFEKVYGEKEAKIWLQRWRIFFMSCAELFGLHNGNEWLIAHYRFSKTKHN
ncbi:SAM-dependent methyltransferase [Kangiella taiwanensis]|uniref:Cyclopropane-fatty-acyl-phospholipid synthase family protein n=1 Tax=Kangiella taiwanensis TaxID=1079179 RepID=A0ABP8HVC6_9GAMM|nr:cyclopropane-fatty-acyl-phospholipid synthase family protein [Kangiella taiwanensis]